MSGASALAKADIESSTRFSSGAPNISRCVVTTKEPVVCDVDAEVGSSSFSGNRKRKRVTVSASTSTTEKTTSNRSKFLQSATTT